MKQRFTLYDSAHYLQTEEDIAGYLHEILKDAGNNAALVTHALGVAARARLSRACAAGRKRGAK